MDFNALYFWGMILFSFFYFLHSFIAFYGLYFKLLCFYDFLFWVYVANKYDLIRKGVVPEIDVFQRICKIFYEVNIVNLFLFITFQIISFSGFWDILISLYGLYSALVYYSYFAPTSFLPLF